MFSAVGRRPPRRHHSVYDVENRVGAIALPIKNFPFPESHDRRHNGQARAFIVTEQLMRMPARGSPRVDCSDYGAVAGYRRCALRHGRVLPRRQNFARKPMPKFDPDQTYAAGAAGTFDGPVLGRRKCTHCDVAMSPRARRIAELNIERYRELLKSETDSSKCRTIVILLAEEEAKLAKLLAEEKDQ
jgi:hypothetical protein